MAFESFADFLSMGGYGSFVWSSYALTVLTIGSLLVVSVLRHRALVAQWGNAKRRRQRRRSRT